MIMSDFTTNPSFMMATGVPAPWNGRDPRAQLTNAGRIAWQQTHPTLLAGTESPSALARFWAWLRGER